MTTDYGKSLVRFDVRDLTEHNRKIVRLAKKKIDQAFRDYIGQGIKDGSIRPCDVKLSAFAIAGSLNWIGHWYQPGRRARSGGHRRRIRDPPHRRARDQIRHGKRRTNRRSGNASHGEYHDERHARPAARAADQSERPCHRLWRSAEELARGRRPRGAACRRHPRARRASRRPCRDPVAQFRPLSRALSCGRLVRHRDRAAQHPLEPAGERRRHARLPRRHPVRRQGLRRRRRDARQRDPGPQADLCRRRRNARRHGGL